MQNSGEIFLDQIRSARALNMGVLTMPTNTPARMEASTANELPWTIFRESIGSMGTLRIDKTGLECLVVPKNIGWSTEDVTIFAGEEHKEISELDDLNIDQGSAFLGVNFFLAEKLLETNDANLIQMSIGFNPGDFSTGHHTVNKLHSHIRRVPHAIDLQRRVPHSWNELRRFDRMAFIEPFAPLYYDFIKHSTKHGILADYLWDEPSANLGYTSLKLHRGVELAYAFPELKNLYAMMKEEYKIIASIYTDNTRDPQTDRFIPRPQNERLELFHAFANSRSFYSDTSLNTLLYLANNIKQAVPRNEDNPYDMSSTAMIYISRGFAGALTFNFERAKEYVGLDFFPRVISTTPVGKTILGSQLPTVINKTIESATEKEKTVTTAYHQQIIKFLAEEFGNNFHQPSAPAVA
jgi:hypothetical protein